MGAKQGINVTFSVSRLPKDAYRGLGPRRTQGIPPPRPPRGRLPSSRGCDPWLGPHSSSPETWVLPFPAVPPGASHLTFAGFSFSPVADVRSPAPPAQVGGPDVIRTGHLHALHSLTTSPGFQAESLRLQLLLLSPGCGEVEPCIPLASGSSLLVSHVPVSRLLLHK